MAHFGKWLRKTFFRRSRAVDSGQHPGPDDDASDSDKRRQMESHGQSKNDKMPDIYNDTDVTVPELKIISGSAAATDEPSGFDPYNTGVFQEKAPEKKL